MSRSRPLLLGLAALAAGLASPTQAFLFSQSTQGTALKHDVRIVDHVVRTTVHEGWADVEEELSLGIQASTTSGSAIPTTNLDSWEIGGNFTLPEGSVLTGALLWNGGTILKAKLKGTAQAGTEYEKIVGRNTVTAVVRDPLLIQKVGSDYSMKLFPVPWNGTRHLRLRYLVPLLGEGDGWSIRLGSAFANEAVGHPQQYELNLENQGGPGVKLASDGMLVPFSTTTKLVDYPAVQGATSWFTPQTAYHSPFSAMLPQKGSIALATSIDSGAWKGGFVMYKGHLPDSILSNSNLRQEILVLWKWNEPQSFVENGYLGKSVSNYGHEMLEQAGTLANSTADLAKSSPLIRVGLVADEGGSSAPRTFGLGSWGSDSFAQLQEYLRAFNEDNLLNRYNPASGTATPAASSATARKDGAKRFATDLQVAFSLYSKDSGVVRHIVFATVGPASDIPDPTVALPAWPLDLTASSYDLYDWYTPTYGTHWTGVDLPSMIVQHALPPARQLTNVYPYTVPLSRVTWNLEFKAGERTFSVDAVTGLDVSTSNAPNLEFNGHALAVWEKSLTWRLYDENGDLIRTAQEPAANWIQLPNDSSVARLWGGSPSHWSETWRTRTVGDVFGFVDPSYSLLAIPSDSLGSRLQTQYQLSGVPYLLGTEIVVYKDSVQEATTSSPTVSNPGQTNSVLTGTIAGFSVRSRTEVHGLRITLPSGLDASSQLVLRDANGRILSQWSGSQLMFLRTIDWNAGLARGMVYVELRTATARTVKTATIL